MLFMGQDTRRGVAASIVLVLLVGRGSRIAQRIRRADDFLLPRCVNRTKDAPSRGLAISTARRVRPPSHKLSAAKVYASETPGGYIGQAVLACVCAERCMNTQRLEGSRFGMYPATLPTFPSYLVPPKRAKNRRLPGTSARVATL